MPHPESLLLAKRVDGNLTIDACKKVYKSRRLLIDKFCEDEGNLCIIFLALRPNIFII